MFTGLDRVFDERLVVSSKRRHVRVSAGASFGISAAIPYYYPAVSRLDMGRLLDSVRRIRERGARAVPRH